MLAYTMCSMSECFAAIQLDFGEQREPDYAILPVVRINVVARGRSLMFEFGDLAYFWRLEVRCLALITLVRRLVCGLTRLRLESQFYSCQPGYGSNAQHNNIVVVDLHCTTVDSLEQL